MKKFENSIVLITGGSGGIGAATARAFINEGAKVAIADILENEGEELASELGENARFFRLDVSIAAQWEATVAKVENTLGTISILVNNAGIAINKPILELTEEEYRKVIDINQVGVFLGMKQVLPSMLNATNGAIINISSLAGFRGTSRGSVAYSASKFALRGMTKAVALEMASKGIRVNTVHPGLIKTPLTMKDGRDEIINHLSTGIPMQRAGEASEVAKLVLFLAGDDASFSTGSEFILDGGQLAKL
ncbi:glucose 1-dehydrogenase [uncultured Draconibacterium sp.]|uniref:SDR family NAD(P)-dependent oxidoreductase n=1 Tax=uncultured Draconibacterium sp. TaxID=1573823 RepID=UPI003217759F